MGDFTRYLLVNLSHQCVPVETPLYFIIEFHLDTSTFQYTMVPQITPIPPFQCCPEFIAPHSGSFSRFPVHDEFSNRPNLMGGYILEVPRYFPFDDKDNCEK